MGCCKCKDHKWADPQPPVWTDPADGKEYCVFHAPVEQKGISDMEFNKLIFKRIQDARKDNQDDTYCLDGTIFPGEIKFSFSDAKIDFDIYSSGSVFSSEIYLLMPSIQSAVLFDGCIFKKQVCIIGGSTDDGAYFLNTKFEDNVRFDGLNFKNDLIFQETTFIGNLKFSRASFKNGIKFLDNKFC